MTSDWLFQIKAGGRSTNIVPKPGGEGYDYEGQFSSISGGSDGTSPYQVGKLGGDQSWGRSSYNWYLDEQRKWKLRIASLFLVMLTIDVQNREKLLKRFQVDVILRRILKETTLADIHYIATTGLDNLKVPLDRPQVRDS